jgi:protein-S-isoprenylcysteine O-methyltransferase
MRRAATVYALLAVFFAGESVLRQEQAAASFEAGAADEGSTRAVGAAIGMGTVALLLAPLLNRVRLGALPISRVPFRTGLAAMVAGLLLRAWSTRVLGAAYTRTLRVVEDQRVVHEGPYRVVRHPGYGGTLLVWLGAALALGNGLTAGFVGVSLVRAYRRRMDSEERMLLETFGDEYRRYMARSRRLAPFLY